MCTVKDCDEPARGRYCAKHWRAARAWLAEEHRLDMRMDRVNDDRVNLAWAEWAWDAPMRRTPDDFGDFGRLENIA